MMGAPVVISGAGPEECERVARSLVAEAEKCEAEGNCERAVQLLKRAYKMCPKLALPDEGEGCLADDDDAATEALSRVDRMPSSDSNFRTFSAAGLAVESTRQEMFDFFNAEGYLVVDDVLGADEIRVAEQHFANFMRTVDIDVNDAVSLRQRFGDSGNGIAHKAGCGQSALNWHVRSRSAVKDTFRLVLGADPRGTSKKLITSFDGFNYFRNPETDPSWLGGTTSWMHFDADDHTNAKYVQGIVNLVDCSDPNDAGLVLLPRSHITVFPHLVTDERRDAPAFMTYMGPGETRIFASLGVREVPFRVPLRAGSMVVWKSSMMHCNIGCLPRAVPNPAQLIRRLVVYVCMSEDNERPAVTQQRRQCFAAGATTCHQPDIIRIASKVQQRNDEQLRGVVLMREEDLPDGAAELL